MAKAFKIVTRQQSMSWDAFVVAESNDFRLLKTWVCESDGKLSSSGREGNILQSVATQNWWQTKPLLGGL